MKNCLYLTVLATVASLPAAAGVLTSAAVDLNFTNNLIGYGYNASSAFGQGFSSGTGFGTISSCPGVGLTSCMFTATPDTTGTLNASVDSISITAADQNNGPQTGSASAYAIANLAQGLVGVAGTGSSNIINGTQYGGTGAAQAQISDSLHFTINGATANTVTPISVVYRVTGSLTGTPVGYANLDSSIGFAQLGSNGANAVRSTTSSANVASISAEHAAGWASYAFTMDVAGGGYVFTGIYDLTGATADVNVAGYLSCFGAASAVCDYSHTGIVSLGMANGVSYTSDSGVFLTQQGSSQTPEPASVGLIGLGIVCLGVLKRKVG